MGYVLGVHRRVLRPCSFVAELDYAIRKQLGHDLLHGRASRKTRKQKNVEVIGGGGGASHQNTCHSHGPMTAQSFSAGTEQYAGFSPVGRRLTRMMPTVKSSPFRFHSKAICHGPLGLCGWPKFALSAGISVYREEFQGCGHDNARAIVVGQ